MKLRVILLLSVGFLVFIGTALPSHRVSRKATPVLVQSTERIIRIHLEGLKATGVDRARAAIQRVPGVLHVSLNASEKEAVVKIDVEQTSIKRLNQSLREAGFTPWIH